MGKRVTTSILVAAVASCLLVVALPASAAPRQHVDGESDTLWLDTSGCPDFVTQQPYVVPFGNTFRVSASWAYDYVDSGPVLTDVKGRLRGVGVDANTGLTYRVSGKFARDVFTTDVIGMGDFRIRRSDGAEMSFTADFNLFGPGSPELFVIDGTVTCTGS